MDCEATTVMEPLQYDYSPRGVDSVQFGIYEVALNAWQSGGFTRVAAVGKKCVEPKQSSKAVFPSSLWAVRAV